MHILVALPGVSYTAFQRSQVLTDPLVSGPFEPTGRTLDVFPRELAGIDVPNMWAVNVPHWPMEANKTKGVAGPGVPQDELFYPPALEKPLSKLCGAYDKWRPYPAQSLSKYGVQMAKRFAKKRCRMFDYVVAQDAASCAFYVEHAPASVAHLSAKTALLIADCALERILESANRSPNSPLLIFSPYGIGKRPGFFVSNGAGRVGPTATSANWDLVRAFLREAVE